MQIGNYYSNILWFKNKDSNTLNTLDSIAKKANRNRSELIREVIPHLSSHDFEKMISLSTLQRLEDYSIKSNLFFENPNFKIKLDEVSENFPAFVVESLSAAILYIKFPTYKIRLLSTNDCVEKIQALISEISGVSPVYLTPCVLITSSETKNTFLPEVMCLNKNLSDNIELKDHLCRIFDKNNFKYEIWTAYTILGKNVNIITENSIKYVVAL